MAPPPDFRTWACQKNSDCDDKFGCTVDTCTLNKKCERTIKAGTCFIFNACYNDGAWNPLSACQVCDTERSNTAWTMLADNAPCQNDSLACTQDVCKGGACQHPLNPNTCLINGTCYQANDPNPANPCETCHPAVSTTKWTSGTTTCYEDVDGDGFGNAAVTKTGCSCSSGWVSKSGDCADDDPDVFPGQTNFFTTQYWGPAGSSWDYDCNGTADLQYKQLGYCKKMGSTCAFSVGWSIETGLEIPPCGVTKAYVTGCQLSSGYCYSTTVQQIQGCR